MSILIGITGGSGCGTTAVGEALKKYGVLFINADAVYHELLANDTELLKKLAESFGDGIIVNGTLDRRALASMVFHDEAQLDRLEKITQPAVIAEIDRMLSFERPDVAAVEAISLIECGLADRCNAIIGVIASKENRIERITLRDGITREAALERIMAQKQDAFFIERCDYIIENNGTIAELEEKLDSIYNMITMGG